MAKEPKKVKKEKKMSGIKAELKKVSWPSAKDIVKYSFATVLVVVLLTGVFSLLNLGLSAIVRGVRL